MRVEVTRKNMSSRNTMSVIEDMLNSALVLALCFIAMAVSLSG
jgi:hypothetical protein